MENISKNWLKDLNLGIPLLIAGPCSAETETQVLTIAHSLKKTDTEYFRAGVWKPRTRPGGFEGVGEIALKWLQKVKQETGLKTATEVANKDHALMALDYDIDLLWIGARSTVSPFIIQEIADALKGTEKIILVKNPVNPDLGLWIGALERLSMAGIKNLGVIHRGFSTYEKTKYRNIPNWQMVIDLQNKFPNLPIICDPSHIGGKRELIFELTQTALDLNLDGLMIETHCDPDNAWSDAAQQITPETLSEITEKVKVRKANIEADFLNEIEKLRSQIDILDDQILDILHKRMQISDKIGVIKKENNISVLQNKRWNEILEKVLQEGNEKNISKDFILNMFKLIHEESIDRQRKIVL